MRFSADGANYYSTAGGHKVGDAHQASEVLCEHRHRGQNATQWSKGKSGAWFVIDLGSSHKLALSHFAYRNDYGGGGNHPRTFVLEGSNDGNTWVVLSSHAKEKWKGKQAKSWKVKQPSEQEQFFQMFRIHNKGKPNHLCCSGIEFYGELTGSEIRKCSNCGNRGRKEANFCDQCGQMLGKEGQ